MANYYVNQYGDDANSGLTEGLAWQTIDKVINFTGFIAGDIVSFNKGDTFLISGDVGFTPAERSATKATALRSPIDNLTFNAYGTGDRPVISGNGNWGAVAMVDSYAKDDITFNGLRFQDGQTVSGVIGSTAYENGYTFAYSGDGLTLIDCVVDGASSFENCIVGRTGAGIDYTIQNCTFQNAQMRAGLYISGITGVLVENCSFLNNNGWDSYESSAECSGLKFNHGGGEITVRNNMFDGNGWGIRIGSGLEMDVYNNIFISPSSAFENTAQINLNDPDDTSGIENLNIYYNTFFLNIQSVKTFAVKVSNTPNYPLNGCNITNNIIMIDGNSTTRQYYIEIGSGYGSGDRPVIDYNLYFTEEDGSWAPRWQDLSDGGSNTTSFTTWQVRHDANGDEDDPIFTDYANKDFTLVPGSPAIGAATPVTDQDSVAILTDYLGNARDAVNPDMGAYEYTTPVLPGESYNMII